MMIGNEQPRRVPVSTETDAINTTMREPKLNENIHVDARSEDRSDIAPGRLYQLSEPTVSCDVPSLGQDLWR